MKKKILSFITSAVMAFGCLFSGLTSEPETTGRLGNLFGKPIVAEAETYSAEEIAEAYNNALIDFVKSDNYKSYEDYGSMCSMYDLYDINSDGIPELFISEGAARNSRVFVYTYTDSECKELKAFVLTYGALYVEPNKSFVVYTDLHMGYRNKSIYEFDGNTLDLKDSFFDNSMNADYETVVYKHNNEEVTEQEYNNALSDYDNLETVCVGRKYFIGGNSYGSLYYTSDGSSVEITDCAEMAVNVVVPNLINGLPVTTIKSKAFSYNSNLESIEIYGNVSDIDKNAIYECSNLKDVLIRNPDCQLIGSEISGCTLWGYEDSTAQEYAEINNLAFESIGTYDYAYYTYTDHIEISGCNKSVKNIVFPSEIDGLPVTELGYSVFYRGSNAETIFIPETVKTINCFDGEGFPGLDNLAEINVSEENTIYSSIDGVLYNKKQTELLFYPVNKADKTFTVPDSVVTLKHFVGAKNLEKVICGKAVDTIESAAFGNCVNLKTVVLSDSVKKIGRAAFKNCRLLTEITIPESVELIGLSAFYCCDSLGKIVINNPDCVIEESVSYINTIPENTVIYGKWESTAHDYANTYSREFVSIDGESEEEYLPGDVTKNGKIDLYDAIEIAKYMMNMIDLDEKQLAAGDLTGDGIVNLYDAIAVCRIIMGM